MNYFGIIKPEKHEQWKLALINLLSGEENIIKTISLEKEIIDIELPYTPWVGKKETGQNKLIIEFYTKPDDNTGTPEQDRAGKGKKDPAAKKSKHNKGNPGRGK